MKAVSRALLGILITFVLVAIPSYADSAQGSLNQLFQVNGTLTEVGNSVCGRAACTEVIHFTTDLYVSLLSPFVPLHQINAAGSGAVNASGALGSGFSVGSFHNLVPSTTYTVGYLPIFGGGQEIDLFFSAQTLAGSNAVTMFFGSAQTYKCLTDACAQDFVLPQYQPATVPIYDATGALFYPVDFQATVTPLPEAPATSLLVVSFLGVIGLLIFERRRSYFHRSNF